MRIPFKLLLFACLCTSGISAQMPKDVQEWLKANNCSINATIAQYDYEHYNTLKNEHSSDLDQKERTFLNSKWTVLTNVRKVETRPDALEFDVLFRCTEGRVDETAVTVDIHLSGWSPENYVLLPAVAYYGNKFESRRLRYSPKLYEVQDIGVDKPIIVSDIPRLDNKDGFSRLQDRSGAFATPSVGFQSGKTQKGFLMLTNYGNTLGDYGISIEESRDRKNADISITSPIVREQYVYKGCDNRVPSWDKGKTFSKGDEVKITFRLYGFKALQIQDLFDRFAEVRKDMSDGKLRNTIPYSVCQTIQEKKFNEQNFVKEYGYYSVGMRENFLQDWQIGWTGGMISTYPLLFMGNGETQKNVIRNFDWLFPNGISPSGFFWDAGAKGTIWYGGDIRKPQSVNWHLIRKSGDAVYYLIKQMMLMEKKGIPVKDSWKDGTQKVCNSFVSLWKKNHQFGQFVDALTGEIRVGGSSSGAIIPAALALASGYFKNPEYLAVAEESADYYYKEFTSKGITCGGPGDALQNPDSESSYSLVESYSLLFECTKNKKWLVDAEQASKQFATWVVTGNYPFPENSLFGQAGIVSTGAVYANTQNKHGAPAICTASGVALLRLYRATGNAFYLNLLQDMAHNITQYLPCEANPIGKVKEGWVCERVNMTDWEGLDRIGEIVGLSTWAETGLMLTTIEIPGLYVQPDKGVFAVFDNIEAKVISNNKTRLTLSLTNPSKLLAKVSILAENEAEAKMPLGENKMFGGESIILNPFQTKQISFKKNH
ncbi:MAG: hypothetical protein PHS30_04205 [Bacteroidales bacterium]|nr:hypothetical protein [Bacteroidales bacterium]